MNNDKWWCSLCGSWAQAHPRASHYEIVFRDNDTQPSIRCVNLDDLVVKIGVFCSDRVVLSAAKDLAGLVDIQHRRSVGGPIDNLLRVIKIDNKNQPNNWKPICSVPESGPVVMLRDCKGGIAIYLPTPRSVILNNHMALGFCEWQEIDE